MTAAPAAPSSSRASSRRGTRRARPRQRRRGSSEAERAFVKHFLTGQPGVRFNASQAVLAAGYRMTPHSAHVHGCKLLSRPSVQQLLESARRRADVTVDDVLQEWKRIAFSDLREAATWDEDGLRLIPSAALADDAAHALSEVIEHRTTRTTTRRTAPVGTPGTPGYVPPGEIETVTVEAQRRVKLHDKIAALTALSKFLGILKEREVPEAPPLFPKDFFAAVVLGDVNRIRAFLPAGDAAEPAIAVTAERVADADA